MAKTLTLPRLHAAQQQIVDSARRFNVVCCGRRFGKTTLAVDRLILPALSGKPTAWYGPSYRALADVWRSLQATLYPVTRDVSQAEHRIELAGGGVIECWSLDSPDAGRGRSYACVVIDEAAQVRELERAWMENIRPQLTDYRGDAWFLSTPKGTASYFHTLYGKGQGLFAGRWRSWRMPTTANPYLPLGEVEDARADMTESAFAQEYEAAFVSWAGAVFRRILDAVMEPPTNVQAAVIGVDWARAAGGDYTVFVALSEAGQVLAIDRSRGLEYAMQRARLQAFWERWGRQVIIAEKKQHGRSADRAIAT